MFLFTPQGVDIEMLKKYQLVMVQRLSSKGNYDAIQLFKQLNMKIVYDLDDDLWSVPHYNPAFHVMKAYLPGFVICATLADVITVSTQHLRVAVRNALGKKCPPVEVVENSIDLDWFRPLPDNLRKNKDGKVVVGWAGTNTHRGDLKRVLALIPRLLREMPQMEFEMVGHEMPDEWLAEFGSRVRQREFVPIAEFAVNWASWQWDIALAPLEDNHFNKSKSSIKMLEAAAVKIPCVASGVAEYWKFASHSKLLKNHVLCDKDNSWIRNISELAQDSALRRDVGEEMYRVAKEHFEVRKKLETWGRIFSEVVQ